MSAEFQNQIGMAFGHQVQSIAQVQIGNGTPRTAHFAVVGRRKHDGRTIKTVFEAAGNNADHALMEVVAIRHQSRLPWRQGFGKIIQRVLQHRLLDFATFDIEVV